MGLLSTLPGDIPGLLRCWSPSLTMFKGIEVRGAWLPRRLPGASAGYVVAQFERTDRVIEYARDLNEVYLDLSDPTARVHAAWWVEQHRRAISVTAGQLEIAWAAERGGDMTPTQIDTLARLVLRLAARSP